MGCDIHLHQEVKINGKWEHYGNPSIPRNYRMFAKMAGVRNDELVTPVAFPGLPDDVTAVTQFDYDSWGRDAHTPCWLDAEGIVSVEEFMESQMIQPFPYREYWGYLFDSSWSGFVKWPEERPKGLEDIRFVFWFDN